LPFSKVITSKYLLSSFNSFVALCLWFVWLNVPNVPNHMPLKLGSRNISADPQSLPEWLLDKSASDRLSVERIRGELKACLNYQYLMYGLHYDMCKVASLSHNFADHLDYWRCNATEWKKSKSSNECYLLCH